MGRKYGRKNVIKVDPLAYNLGLIGESGIGKTTLAKEVCENLVGEDGYIIANCGKEDGIDAIAGAIYEDIPDWDVFDEFTEDIIENKLADYKDLRVIVWDTFDELLNITEPEVIRLHNKENPEKPVKSIKATFGGYMAGEDKAISLVLERLWELKRVGVSFFIIGHTKKRTLTDVSTGIEYDMLTTNMSHRYFNALKNKLHVLGVASINRQITQFKTGKKIKGKDEVKGTIENESRIITFRDDNFNIDSKSRFSEIIDSVEFSSDEFIGAIEDAIKKEHEKQSGAKSIEATKVEQDKSKDKKIEENVNKQKAQIEEKKEAQIKENLIDEFKTLMAGMRGDKNKTTIVAKKLKELGMSAKELDLATCETLQELIEYVKTV